MAIDYASPRGQVRLLTADLDESAQLLTDDQLDGFLAMAGGAVRLAAAEALEAMATSETLVARKITTQGLALDGPAVAADLRKRAAVLRVQHQADLDEAAAADLGYITVYPAGGTRLEAEEYRL